MAQHELHPLTLVVDKLIKDVYAQVEEEHSKHLEKVSATYAHHESEYIEMLEALQAPQPQTQSADDTTNKCNKISRDPSDVEEELEYLRIENERLKELIINIELDKYGMRCKF